MIKIYTGKKDEYGLSPSIGSLENYNPISAPKASEFFRENWEYMLGRYNYYDDPSFGPNLEEIYQAFRVRLLYELKDHIPGLVEIVEEDEE